MTRANVWCKRVYVLLVTTERNENGRTIAGFDDQLNPAEYDQSWSLTKKSKKRASLNWTDHVLLPVFSAGPQYRVAAQAAFDFPLFFWYASARRTHIKQQLRAQIPAWCALAEEQINSLYISDNANTRGVEWM